MTIHSRSRHWFRTGTKHCASARHHFVSSNEPDSLQMPERLAEPVGGGTEATGQSLPASGEVPSLLRSTLEQTAPAVLPAQLPWQTMQRLTHIHLGHIAIMITQLVHEPPTLQISALVGSEREWSNTKKIRSPDNDKDET